MTTPTERREELKLVWEEARRCRDCVLHETRTTVVFGAGNANADLMFIGEAPGKNEDLQGLPFVGQAGKLLNQLLEEVGLSREDVFVCNTLKCRPPGNRDPYPNELQSCQKYLWRQIELIQPTVIATLGNFATKLLRDDPTGITKLHGQAEERLIGPRRVRLYPLYHPAAALYTRSMVDVLREDFARIPDLLAQGPPEQPAAPEPEPVAAEPEPQAEPELEVIPPAEAEASPALEIDPETPAPEDPRPADEPSDGAGGQLGLF